MYCKNCGNELSENARFCAKCGAKIDETKAIDISKATGNQSHPPKSKKIVVSIVTIVALVLASISGVWGYHRLQKPNIKDREKSLVYVTYDEVYYVEDMDSDEEPCLISKIDNQCMDDSQHFKCRPRIVGDYVYFFDKINSDGYGNLCRIQISSIQKDIESNEQQIERINMAVGEYHALANDVVVFLDKNLDLCYVDGEKTGIIDYCVETYAWSTNKEVVWYMAEYGADMYRLAFYSFSEGKAGTIDESTDFDWRCSDDGNQIVYSKPSGEETVDLYWANIDGKRELISAEVCDMVGFRNMKSIFYEKQYARSSSDNGEDMYGESGCEIVMPEKRDYLVPTNEEYVLENCNIPYFVEHPDALYDYLYYEEEIGYLNLYYDGGEEFAFTPFYYDEETNQWYEWSETEYYAALEEYENAQDCVNAWESSEQQIEKVTDLYHWSPEEGEKKVAGDIQTGLIRTDEDCKAIFYCKNNKSGSDSNMNVGTEYCFYMGNESETIFVDGVIDYYFFSDDMTKMMASVSGEKDRIIEYELKDGHLNEKGCIAENTEAGKWIEDRFYYFKESEEGAWTFCYYEEQKETVLAENVEDKLMFFYENGEILYTGTCFDDHVPLNVIDKSGKSIEVESAVLQYIYVSENRIVYSKEGGLYVYYGDGETKMIAQNVDYFACAESCSYQTAYFI